MPRYKEGDANSFENYRPISLPSPLAEVSERAIYDRNFLKVVSYSKFDILSVDQFSTREIYKTRDDLVCVVEYKNAVSLKNCLLLVLSKT